VDKLLLAGIIVLLATAASIPALYMLANNTTPSVGGEGEPGFTEESPLYKGIVEYWQTAGRLVGGVAMPAAAPVGPAGTVTVTTVTAMVLEAGSQVSYSSGNFQVEGVVEDDIAAFNGTHLYVLNGKSLLAYRVYPAETAGRVWSIDAASICEERAPSINVTIEVGGASSTSTISLVAVPHGLILEGDTLYLLCSTGRQYRYLLPAGPMPLAMIDPSLLSTTLVVAVDASNGSVVWSSSLMGSMVGARLVEGGLLVTTAAPTAVFLYGEPVPLLPVVDGEVVPEDDVRVVGDPGYYVLVALYGPDGLVDYSVVASERPSAIVATGWGLVVATFDMGESRILSFQAGPGVEYAGNLTVEGAVRSQWQLQPYGDEYLVVIYGDTGAGVGLKVLRGPGLEPVGGVEGLITNQDIHGVRLIGDTLYFVTFRRVDPLFAVDLSDPAQPRVLGYLEAPGFDQYLHPTSHGLLGVGLENDRVRVTLYRLDGGVPEPVDRIYLHATSTPLLAPGGHKAFAYVPGESLALVPVNGILFEDGGEVYMFDTSIYYAIHVGEDGLTLEARLGTGIRAYWVESQIVILDVRVPGNASITLYDAGTLEPLATIP